MNLNPLFWVNELKEIGRGMKTAGPITGILWCITCFHSPHLLCAFCLYPLCYSLIILLGVRGDLPNCANGLTLRIAQILPVLVLSLAVLSHLALCQLIQLFDFPPFFSLVHSAYFALSLYFIISSGESNVGGPELIQGVDVCQRGADMTSSNKMLGVSFLSVPEDHTIADLLIRYQTLRNRRILKGFSNEM